MLRCTAKKRRYLSRCPYPIVTSITPLIHIGKMKSAESKTWYIRVYLTFALFTAQSIYFFDNPCFSC